MTMTSEPTAIRCSATISSGRRCGGEAVTLLQYDSNGFRERRRQSWDYGVEHPLCDVHADPAFHLRDVSTPNWRLIPVKQGGTGGDRG
jgi:hypothetical protein